MAIEPKINFHRFNKYYTAIEPLLASQEAHAYGLLILSLLTMAFFGYFAIRPTLSTISNLNRQISDAQLVDQKLQEKITALSTLSQQYNAIQPDLGIVWTALPREIKFTPSLRIWKKLPLIAG